MELVHVDNEQGWLFAEAFLNETVERCNQRDIPLWTHEQVCMDALKKSYPADSLYLFRYQGNFVGCVFIVSGADEIWSDIDGSDSLFFHKLAIGDKYLSQGLGHQALEGIVQMAKNCGLSWLRCDCRAQRPRLRAFYERFGFCYVDTKELSGLALSRYQLPTV